MAERRMFAKSIIDSDMFLDMPLQVQDLYFHLSIRADDDGFLNNAQKIIRMIGASRSDYDLLVSKKFIIDFEDGICAITHWRMHNYIRQDRYKPTLYQKQFKRLTIGEDKSYAISENIKVMKNTTEKNKDKLCHSEDTQLLNENDDAYGEDSNCYGCESNCDGCEESEGMNEAAVTINENHNISRTPQELNYKSPSFIKNNKKTYINEERQLKRNIEEKSCDDGHMVDQMDTQVRLGKDRGGEVKSDIVHERKSGQSKIRIETGYINRVMEKWNELGIGDIVNIKNSRLKLFRARINEHGIDKVLEAIANIDKSKFLKGQNDRGWTITFDWLMRPDNFSKVLECNYEDKINQASDKKHNLNKNLDYKNNSFNKNEIEPGKFNNFKPREYDYDELERKLLGW